MKLKDRKPFQRQFISQLDLHNFEIAFDFKNKLIEDGEVMRSELKGQIDIKPIKYKY